MDEAATLTDCTVIKMDPNSPEWKAKIAGLQEQLKNKYDGDLHEDTSPGYRKH